MYIKQTNSLLYSYLAAIPLFVGYELLLFISQPTTEQVVRISVDVWIKSLFNFFGVQTLSLFLLLLLLAGIFILHRERERFAELKTQYFIYIIIESFLYAVLVALLSSFLTANIVVFDISYPAENSLTYLQKFSLSLGAGLYEELFYRVILFTALLKLAAYFFKSNNNKWLSYSIAVITSSMLFSTAHYIGSLGDIFTLHSFTFRFIFGVLLTLIYIYRGFGVTAWTHAIYDLLVITFYS